MATPKRASKASSTTRSKKAATTSAQESTTLPKQQASYEEAIRLRAYQLYEERGRTHGLDKEDWLRAEGEVVSSHGAHSA
jgi:hypothetical protein